MVTGNIIEIEEKDEFTGLEQFKADNYLWRGMLGATIVTYSKKKSTVNDRIYIGDLILKPFREYERKIGSILNKQTYYETNWIISSQNIDVEFLKNLYKDLIENKLDSFKVKRFISVQGLNNDTMSSPYEKQKGWVNDNNHYIYKYLKDGIIYTSIERKKPKVNETRFINEQIIVANSFTEIKKGFMQKEYEINWIPEEPDKFFEKDFFEREYGKNSFFYSMEDHLEKFV